MRSVGIEIAAETHYMIRPALERGLGSVKLVGEGKRLHPNCENFRDLWVERLGDRFFDMSTLIRVATGVETGLRDYYVEAKGYENLTELRQDPEFQAGMFQRILPWQRQNGVIGLFEQLGVDLESKPNFSVIQELMLHRHLYAHGMGILDDKYIENLKRLNSVDLLADPIITNKYPAEDVYYFAPLRDINRFIEGSRKFFRALD